MTDPNAPTEPAVEMTLSKAVNAGLRRALESDARKNDNWYEGTRRPSAASKAAFLS